MAKTRDIQRRIKSIGNIKKITRAMEMVAAAKMRKAVEAALKTRTYANLSWETVLNITRMSAEQHEPLHPLLAKRETIQRVAIILFTSNRGLCGGFNSSLISKVRESIRKHQQLGENTVIDTEFILLGKKGEIVERLGYNVAAVFPKLDVALDYSEIQPVASLARQEFLNGYYDKVLVAYTDYVNAAKQQPKVKQLLPIELSDNHQDLGVVGKSAKLATSRDYIETKSQKHLVSDGFVHEYTFEPSRAEVLDAMLPKLIEVQLFQALLETNASEHSARMAAMHQANDAAGGMVDDLTLFYNKARQAGITAEIAEISAGANALE
jgi:F-type H+-transporting ATPase subunit gamma